MYGFYEFRYKKTGHPVSAFLKNHFIRLQHHALVKKQEENLRQTTCIYGNKKIKLPALVAKTPLAVLWMVRGE
jgi:hypothetical protein